MADINDLNTTSLSGNDGQYSSLLNTNFSLIKVVVDAINTSLTALVARLINTTAPLAGGGALSSDLTLSINQATTSTDGYLTQTDWDTFNGKVSNPMEALGDMIVGGASGTPSRLATGTSAQVLHGGTSPSWSAVTESQITLSAVTTNDASATKHGFCPTLSNSATTYLNGTGSWTTPSGSGGAVVSYSATAFTGQTEVTVTHNFGAYPVVQVINGSGVVIAPASITHSSTNAVVVAFGGSTTGTILLSVGSPQLQAYRAVSDNYTAAATDRIIKVTVSGKTITLPTAVGVTGREYVIDNASTSTITVDPDGTETIEGESTQTVPSSSALVIYSDGANWRMY